MITEAFQHCRGVGPIRLAELQQCGIRTWHDAVACPEQVPGVVRASVVDECRRSLAALEADDIQYFVDRLSPPDRWRILSRYLDKAAWFDIETTGLEYDDTITVIVCYHKRQLHTFVEHENLDDFLDLLDDIDLLVSFNGSSFDVPRVLDAFHIPGLPCPHLDLRWSCYYHGLHGGLKHVSAHLGIQRPADLRDADGELAVRLWSQWQQQGHSDSRDQLIRYCAADVLLLRPLSEFIARRPVTSTDQLWEDLPSAAPLTPIGSPLEIRRQILATQFGSASPSRLRMRRPR
ncbi:MAG: ribonuclease H-like domain-containing protein [Planctomycetaceae bacterium]